MSTHSDGPQIVKRVSLEGIYEGWDDSCYALVRPCNFETRIAAADLEKENVPEADQVTFQTKLVVDHFVRATGVSYENGDFAKVELTAEKAAELPDVSNKLALYILGYDLDPKDLREAVANADVQNVDSTATKTSSSTDSPETSTSELN